MALAALMSDPLGKAYEVTPKASSALAFAARATGSAKSALVIETVVLAKLIPPPTAAVFKVMASAKLSVKLDRLKVPLLKLTPLPVCEPVGAKTKPTPALASLSKFASTVAALPSRSLVANDTLRLGVVVCVVSAVNVIPPLIIFRASATARSAPAALMMVPACKDRPAEIRVLAASYVSAVGATSNEPVVKLTP